MIIARVYRRAFERHLHMEDAWTSADTARVRTAVEACYECRARVHKLGNVEAHNR